MDVPDVLIKVSEKREYLESLSQGKVYMKESGYFRKLEDGHRGDPYDGIRPVTPGSNDYIILGDEHSPAGSVKIPASNIVNMRMGFKGDDKVPLFCCSLLSEDILVQKGDREFNFKAEFVSEMKKFGNYCMMFRLNDLVAGLCSSLDDPLARVICRPVSYVKIMQEYDGTPASSDPAGRYASFFKKDLAYRWQNEWRILLMKLSSPLITPTIPPPFIGPTEDHYIATIPPFNQYGIMTLDDMAKESIRVQSCDK